MPEPDTLHPERRVFHVGPMRLWLAPALFLGMGLLVMAAFRAEGGQAASAGWAALAFGAGLAAFFFAMVYHTTLTVDAEGLELRQIGYTIRTAWSNVERIDLTPWNAVVILREPGVKGFGKQLLRGAVKMTPPAFVVGGPAKELAEGRALTLEPFMAHYRRGPLRDLLQRYKPELVV